MTPVPYATQMPEADPSCSFPGHGVACHPGYSVCLDLSRPTRSSPTTSRRTYNIAQRSFLVGRTIIAVYFVIVLVRHCLSSSDGSRPHVCADGVGL